MARTIISTANAPSSPLYSQSVKAGPHLLLSGILLTHPTDFTGLNEEYARWFPSNPPTPDVAQLGVDHPASPAQSA